LIINPRLTLLANW